jgi:hypothetical protein
MATLNLEEIRKRMPSHEICIPSIGPFHIIVHNTVFLLQGSYGLTNIFQVNRNKDVEPHNRSLGSVGVYLVIVVWYPIPSDARKERNPRSRSICVLGGGQNEQGCKAT